MHGGRYKVALLLVLAVLLAGCWDRREIEEKSNVLASGLDVCDETPDCRMINTRQIAIPGRIPLGGGAEGGTDSGDTVLVISTPGRDGPDTARRAQAELNRIISFGHTRVLVFSADFARRGVEEFLDYVRRHPEARRLLWITVSEGRAEAVIRARPPLERVPAVYLSDMIDDAVRTGRMAEVFMGEFLVRAANKGEEPIAPLVRMLGPDRPQLAGLAVFRDYRMVGSLSPEETVTYMQLRGLPRGAELLDIPLPGGNHADLEVHRRGVKERLRSVQGRIHADLEISLETDLIQLSHGVDSSDPLLMAEIERRAAELVTRRAQALVQRLQHELGADILAIGERVRAHLPAVWAGIEDWSTKFPEVRFHFDVRIHIRRTGMAKE